MLDNANGMLMGDNKDVRVDNYDMNIVASPSSFDYKSGLLASINALRIFVNQFEAKVQESKPSQVEIMLDQLNKRESILTRGLAPREIDMPTRGGIQQIQAHVTDTRLGHGVKHAKKVTSTTGEAAIGHSQAPQATRFTRVLEESTNMVGTVSDDSRLFFYTLLYQPAAAATWRQMTIQCAAEHLAKGCVGPASIFCGACGAVRYCCSSHQRLHWPEHKNDCQRFEKQMKLGAVLHEFPFTFTEESTFLVSSYGIPVTCPQGKSFITLALNVGPPKFYIHAAACNAHRSAFKHVLPLHINLDSLRETKPLTE
ncbi:hypothetical protein L7F22_026703 [Adiantum nelumboides]|nr:hypothetical protein [Adiantum nelumboides]